jgi:hypothetical protein
MTENIFDYIEGYGLDAIYLLTALCIASCLWFMKDLDRWSELEDWHKQMIISFSIGTTFMIVVSVLRLTGVITVF